MEETTAYLKKLYDYHIHWSAPFFCNLRCEYCFNRGLWLKKQPEFPVDKVINTLNNTGKTFLISLCGGGEWFMIKDSLEIFKRILEKHYVIMNTNLTMNTEKLKQFLEIADLSKIIDIDASLHIKELKRLNLTDVFIKNFLLLKGKGVSIAAKACLYPPLIKEAHKYVDFFESKGIYIAWDKYIGEYDGKKYPGAYTPDELELIREQNVKKSDLVYSRLSKSIFITKQDYRIEHNGTVIDMRSGKKVGHILDKIDI